MSGRRLRWWGLGAAVVLLAGCGDAAAPPSEPTPGSAANPLVGHPNPPSVRISPIPAAKGDEDSAEHDVHYARERFAGGRIQPLVSRPAGSRSVAERARQARPATARPHPAHTSRAGAATPRRQRPAAPSAARPCSLVSVDRARAIAGRGVVVALQAPQGPTCIFAGASGSPYATLSVQAGRLAALTKGLPRAGALRVAGRPAVCSSGARPVLYVPLSGRRVLTVSGPCRQAARFAAAALEHL